MNRVWLVTGSASGLGRNIAEAVLESGDRLLATARDPKRLDDLVKKYGDRVRAVPLDVTAELAAQAAVQTAVGTFGRLDVVVNNAGYSDIVSDGIGGDVLSEALGALAFEEHLTTFRKPPRQAFTRQFSSFHRPASGASICSCNRRRPVATVGEFMRVS